MIRIGKAAWEAMQSHAEENYPEEACGACMGLVGANGDPLIRISLRLINRATDPRTHYECDLDPAYWLAARTELQFLGIYHSHADADAFFSSHDIEQSAPWFFHLVLSIHRAKFKEASCWWPREGLAMAADFEIR
jgi:proteasome lid subunit RPN8/RPN11